MRVLRQQRPTPEQIRIVQRIQQGAYLIRGAAGSGKTTTALMALRATTGAAVNELQRGDGRTANVLVLTYNNTLAGYVEAVAREELSDYADNVQAFILTFDKWAYRTLGWKGRLPIGKAESQLQRLAILFPRALPFVLDEVHYVLGRFRPDSIDDYLSKPRTGRGAVPQMDRPMRQRLLNEVVKPYLAWKAAEGVRDFYDLAIAMSEADADLIYDVVVIDEAQDFSANQLRAVAKHCAPDVTLTLVTDTAQRIYPRGGALSEAGIEVTPARSFRLSRNYRNTKQIAALAASIAQGLPIDEDGSLPDPSSCTVDGDRPVIVYGKFSEQIAAAIDRIAKIDLTQETVGFLHIKGGGFFKEVRKQLDLAGYEFCELQSTADWPENGANIGLSTLYSAKGLEFDHVFILGLAQNQTSHGEEADDDRHENLRRMLAMAVGRARKSVMLGTKPGEALNVLEVIDLNTIVELGR